MIILDPSDLIEPVCPRIIKEEECREGGVHNGR